MVSLETELYDALVCLRAFMWAEGYADQVDELSNADEVIQRYEEEKGIHD
jgi:hypothetical protein